MKRYCRMLSGFILFLTLIPPPSIADANMFFGDFQVGNVVLIELKSGEQKKIVITSIDKQFIQGSLLGAEAATALDIIDRRTVKQISIVDKRISQEELLIEGLDAVTIEESHNEVDPPRLVEEPRMNGGGNAQVISNKEDTGSAPIHVIPEPPVSDKSFRIRLGVGVGALILAGYQDYQAIACVDECRWILGLRHIEGTETFEDPFTGNNLTDTTETKTGVTLYRLFDITGMKGSLYAGGGFYKHSLEDLSLITGEIDSDSATVPMLGGGYFRWFGNHGFFNLTLMLGLGGTLKTETSVSMEETSSLDVDLILGLAF